MEEEVLPNKNNSKRGRETLFRSAYQNQSNLIQMADNKANIIISINTMIISSIIAITSYGAVAGKIDSFGIDAVAPIVMIVLSCLVSVIFAIQAARPKLITPKLVDGTMQRSSLLFFGVIAGYSQKAYLEEMERLLNAGDELYEHMTIDIHNQGIVLKRKYALLAYAYQVFMFGFVLSVLVFLIFLAL